MWRLPHSRSQQPFQGVSLLLPELPPQLVLPGSPLAAGTGSPGSWGASWASVLSIAPWKAGPRAPGVSRD